MSSHEDPPIVLHPLEGSGVGGGGGGGGGGGRGGGGGGVTPQSPSLHFSSYAPMSQRGPSGRGDPR